MPEGTSHERSVSHPPERRREILAWAMYDWANSGYSTIAITVLVSYLTATLDAISEDLGALIWGWGIGLTMLAAAILSPILGAIADAHASKRRWLAVTAWSGSAACVLMIFATPDRPWLLVALFLAANFSFELSLGFYNGFLPEIAADDEIDRVSAWGYSLGYFGGALPLVLFLLIYSQGHYLGLPRADGDPTALVARVGLAMTGVWWGLFTIPTIVGLKDRGAPKHERRPLAAATRTAISEVGRTLRHIRSYRMLVIFLVGFLIYNDGVQTVMSQASVFAGKILDMKSGELALVILMIQFIAMPGAWIVGRISIAWSQKSALSICLGVWSVLLVAAFFITQRWQFWIMSVFAALVLGGTQSVSRAMMARMTPLSHSAEFFGFFNLSGKATSILGPILFTSVLYTTKSAHYAISALLVFFVVGWAIVSRVDVRQGQHEAQTAGREQSASP
jgi:UMF1 family MFS transporter